MRRIRAFSLIEVLVVVSIIVLLVSITMPSFREARRVARKTVCMKNLATIGLGIHAYLLTNRDTFPWVCGLPSYEAHLAHEESSYKPRVSLPVALKSEMSGKSEVFLCPADLNAMMPDNLARTTRYYDTEGLSYEWETRLNGRHLSFKELTYLDDLLKLNLSQYRMVADFEPFHGGSLLRGSWNTLYVDLHVRSDNKAVVPAGSGINW